MIYDLIIIGCGPAGLAAAIYAGRYRIKTLVLGKKLGGQAAIAGKIENYPGCPSIDGFELISSMKKQAADLDVEIIEVKVDQIKQKNNIFEILAGGTKYQAKVVIMALGVKRRHLNLVNEKELTGKGVHYCITCDGPVYTGKTIAIVGGGDSSVKGTNLSAEYADKIYLIVLEKKIIAEPFNYEQMMKLGDKVKVLLETQVKEIIGKDKLEKIILSKEYQGSKELVIDGLFIEIGSVPDSELAKSLGVELNEAGYIKVDNMMKTNINGVFAAGDAVNYFNRFKQIITATATGSVAATSAYEYLKRSFNNEG